MSADELKLLPQWACSHQEKKRRAPRDIFGKKVSVTDPRAWDTYDNCKASDFPCIGFIFSANDPYAVIDLDEPVDEAQAERHRIIVEQFDSYTEVSTSGTGLHIIVKGNIPHGVRRDNVEVYSDARYMICTDRAINEKPIEQRQELLDVLFAEMDSTNQIVLEQHDALMSDKQVVEMGERAVNSEKFIALCRGDMEGYPSQSEADFALMSIFAYYTRDNDQVKRLFRMSALGKRAKAQRESYLNTALRKIRAKQPTAIDSEQIRLAMQQPEQDAPEPEAELPDKPPTVEKVEYTYPPGLVGEVARYIEQSATRPVREVGLAAALALCSGLWGRAYNISGTGLNQYIILLARTGTGKEGAATGIDNVIGAMRKTLPSVERCLGPAGFASGQALLRSLDKQPGFVSVLGEFGITLQQICDPRANMAQTMLKRVLLDLYGRSGHGKIMRATVYADSEKNTKAIVSPAVTLLGESTPETFYSGIDQEHIAEGLIPRFSVMHYEGDRPVRNRKAFFAPPGSMVEEMVEVSTAAMQIEQNYNVVNIRLDAGAAEVLDALDLKADAAINKTSSDMEAQLWNRAHLKGLKLAGLISVGVSHTEPIVSREIAEWAVDMVEKDVNGVLQRFATGVHGTGNVRQEGDLRAAMEKYSTLSTAKRMQYTVPKALRSNGNIIPFGYLRGKLRLLASFKSDKRGEVGALKALLAELVEAEVLVRIPDEQAFAEYKTKQALYLRGAQW
jgi:hypothetical protein